jgi:hypothetical protein
LPSSTPKQARFMSAIAHSPEFAHKVGVPQSVGKEFHAADAGKKWGARHKSTAGPKVAAHWKAEYHKSHPKGGKKHMPTEDFPYQGWGGGETTGKGGRRHDFDHEQLEPHNVIVHLAVGIPQSVEHPSFPTGSRPIGDRHLWGTANVAHNGSSSQHRSFTPRSAHMIGSRSPSKNAHCFGSCRGRHGK